jgi:hypothetical protein
MLTLFIAAFQMLLDRGPGEDWFHSREIWTYAILAVVGLWVFVIHTMTTRHPFFDPGLIRDRNFVTASIFGFFVGILLFSTMALLPPMMQTLMGYPVLTSGLVSMPRGLGSFVAMFAVGRLIGRVDTRLILLTGLSISCVALWQMMHFDLSMTETPFIVSGIIQGLGIGLLFVPLSTLAFATLPPRLRPEGSSVYTLIRNLGASVGISIMNALVVANTQTMHSSLAARIIPSDAMVRTGLPLSFDPSTTAGISALNGEITRQATMVAYVDDFRLMFFITIACMPMLLFMRKPRRAAGAEPIMPLLNRSLRRLAATASVLALSACATVGPNFKPPEAPKGAAAAGYAMAGDAVVSGARLTPETRAAGPWWQALGSPELDAAVREALAANPTVAEANANLQKAQAQLAATRGAQLPQVDAAASVSASGSTPSPLALPAFQPDHPALFHRRNGELRPRPVRRPQARDRGRPGPRRPGRPPGRRRLSDADRRCRAAGYAHRQPSRANGRGAADHRQRP